MSRIGEKPVQVPDGVDFSVEGRRISVSGPKGSLSYEHRLEVEVSWDTSERAAWVRRHRDDRKSRAYHGLTRSLIRNMVQGVSQGFQRDLEINGVGWGAESDGNQISLSIGFADKRVLGIPEGVDVQVSGGNRITVSGPDKQQVGQFAARIRGQRPPEPYNAKGIKYADEEIVQKEGKAFGSR